MVLLHDALWAGKTERAVTFGELLTRAERRKNPWYVEVMRTTSVEHEMKVWLSAPPGVIRGFFATRGADVRDFDGTPNDLRPPPAHLAAIREQWHRRSSPAGLTEREVEVLRLLREGLTNRDIAAVIATSTVRTHLENVFEKLGVHTRTAAVARAFDRNT